MMERSDKGKREALQVARLLMSDEEWTWDAADEQGLPLEDLPLLNAQNAEAFRIFAIKTINRQHADLAATALLQWFGKGAFSQGMFRVLHNGIAEILA